jgi:hypothetical protein
MTPHSYWIVGRSLRQADDLVMWQKIGTFLSHEDAVAFGKYEKADILLEVPIGQYVAAVGDICVSDRNVWSSRLKERPCR